MIEKNNGREWAAEWLFKRSVEDLESLSDLVADTEQEIEVKQARAILVGALMRLRGGRPTLTQPATTHEITEMIGKQAAKTVQENWDASRHGLYPVWTKGENGETIEGPGYPEDKKDGPPCRNCRHREELSGSYSLSFCLHPKTLIPGKVDDYFDRPHPDCPLIIKTAVETTQAAVLPVSPKTEFQRRHGSGPLPSAELAALIGGTFEPVAPVEGLPVSQEAEPAGPALDFFGEWITENGRSAAVNRWDGDERLWYGHYSDESKQGSLKWFESGNSEVQGAKLISRILPGARYKHLF